MDPVLTGVGIIGQGGPQTISGGSISQSIVQGGKSVIRSNVTTHVLRNSSKMTLNTARRSFRRAVSTIFVKLLSGLPYSIREGAVLLLSVKDC